MKKIMFLIFYLAAITFITRSVWVQANRFLDNNPPSFESFQVQSIGKYYQPFRVDYFEGESKKLNKRIRVPVLKERAESTAIGEQVTIAIGTGLLCKKWVAPKDKCKEYNTGTFKAVSMGIYLLILTAVSFLYFKDANKRIKHIWASGLFVVTLGVSLLLFYLI